MQAGSLRGRVALFAGVVGLLLSSCADALVPKAAAPATLEYVPEVTANDGWERAVVDLRDSEIPPSDLAPPTVPISVSEPYYGEVGVDRVVLATRILGLDQPLLLTTQDATALLAEARDAIAVGNVAGPAVQDQLTAVLGTLEVGGPPVDPDLDVASLLATARSELRVLAEHHRVPLPKAGAQLAVAARQLADLAGVPADLPLHVRLAAAQQRRVFDQAADRVAAGLGARVATQDVQVLEDGRVAMARVHAIGPDGPVRFWMLGLHPADPSVGLRVSAPEQLLATSTHAAQFDGAVVAVNGGFWTAGADPDGLTVVDGLLVSDTSSGKTWVRNRRPAFGVGDGRAHAGKPDWTLAIADDDSSAAIPVRGYERPVNGPADLIATVGAPAEAPDGTPTIAIDVRPEELLVSSARTRRLADLVQPPAPGLSRLFLTGNAVGRYVGADGVHVVIDVDAGFAGLDEVIAGGPTLLRGGHGVELGVWRQEGFGPRHTDDRHPRTFAGVDRWGNVLLVVADGRQPGWSVGLTHGQAAAVAAALDLVEAIQLDGGGSSTFVQQGRVLNRPSDGRQRPVATALVVVNRG